ncbi:MAG: ABC transporter ATP-binding protein [Planctomycetota bacterium]|nr:ABC transporter ATP-binding protein [Planctomycetota bacterium]
MNRLGDLFRLLRPHARPHLGALVLIVVFGTASAMLQQGTFLLLLPTWEALFPEEEGEGASAPVEGVSVPPDGAAAGDSASGEAANEADVTGVDEPAGVAPEPAGLSERLRAGALERILGPEEERVGTGWRMPALYRVGAIVVLMALLASLTHYGMGILAGLVGLRLVVSLRMQLAEHLMGLSLRYHTGRRFGDLLSRISSDVGRTTQVVQLILKDLVQEPLMFVVSIGIAAYINWKVTLFVLLGLPLFVVPIMILVRKVRKGSHRSATQLGSTFQVLTQMFQGVRTVKAYRTEERELERFAETNRSYLRATMKMIRASTLSRAWTILFTNAGIAFVVVFVGYVVIDEGAFDNGGAMLTFFLMISQASSHLKRTTRVIAQISEAQGAAQRLQDILDERPDVVERPGAVALSGLGSGIRFEGVGFEYPGEDEEGDSAPTSTFALSSIDLEVRPGETLALVGPSGSGKSTMLDLVARFVDPSSGRVTVDGHDLKDVTFDSWTSSYALVTQAPFLFHASIAENIRYGRPDASREEVVAAARAANIHEFIEALPEGYETNVKDAGTRLSGGQRQRITIARALLRDPELLLLDEATSALDTESEAAVQAALEEMMVGRTTIVIAHRLSTVRNADRIAVLDGGCVVELGSHEELVAGGGLYSRLSEAQAI